MLEGVDIPNDLHEDYLEMLEELIRHLQKLTKYLYHLTSAYLQCQT